MKRSTTHTVVAAFLAVAVALTLTAPAAVAASLVECADIVTMDMETCETASEPCCCDTHSDGASDQIMSELDPPVDEAATGSMPACNCSLSSSEPAPIVPVAVPAYNNSPVVIVTNGVIPNSEFAPLQAYESATERGPAPSHEGIYLSHCALLR